jgi:hypothetical protein
MERMRQKFVDADIPLPEDAQLPEEPEDAEEIAYLPTADRNRFIKVVGDFREISPHIEQAILEADMRFRTTYGAVKRLEYIKDAFKNVRRSLPHFRGVYNRRNREVVNVSESTRELSMEGLRNDLRVHYDSVVESESHIIFFSTPPRGFQNEAGQPVATAQDIFDATKSFLRDRGVNQEIIDAKLKMQSRARVKHNELRELEDQGIVKISEGTRKTTLAVALQSANTVNIPENLQPLPPTE